jgi:hypothetical protein
MKVHKFIFYFVCKKLLYAEQNILKYELYLFTATGAIRRQKNEMWESHWAYYACCACGKATGHTMYAEHH